MHMGVKKIEGMVANHNPSIHTYGKNGFTRCKKLGMERIRIREEFTFTSPHM